MNMIAPFHGNGMAIIIGPRGFRVKRRDQPSLRASQSVYSKPEDSMESMKTIALVAHDNRKQHMVEWVEYNWGTLLGHRLVCTGTTGRLVEDVIKRKAGKDYPGDFFIRKLKSGPLGGDQQLGALIADGEIDAIIFFWDPMSPHPHDVDVKALLRISVLYNLPIACNRSTADFIISSPLLAKPYEPVMTDYGAYIERELP